jgi:hypothetical protein
MNFLNIFVLSDKDPNIWIKALSYFANKDPKEECKNEITEVLMSIQHPFDFHF